jgi:glycosyltransferase involved in cell wall biosynthesis
MTKQTQLTLFFTKGVSLQSWMANGSFEREIALYLKYLKAGWKVSFITYGNKLDLLLEPKLAGIQVHCNRWNLTENEYEKYLHYLFGLTFASTDVIKVHQMRGADIGLQVSSYWNKPLVARCGYLETLTGTERIAVGRLSETELRATTNLEREVFSQAEKVIVTTQEMKTQLMQEYNIPAQKVNVIPNFVQTDVFIPSNQVRPLNKIIYIGRLSKEKNLQNLIMACQGLDVELTFIGTGPEEQVLHTASSTYNVPVNFVGVVLIANYLNT